jgi:putative tryptophan/tyrosine transport system substrate-binding protein
VSGKQLSGSSKRAVVFMCLLLTAMLPCFFLAAQQTHTIPRIGYLSARSPDREQRTQTAFEQGLRELGYRVGKSIVIEYRYSPNYEKLRDLAAELVALHVDVILAAGLPPARAAKQITDTIPIVMGQTGDPVATGLIASLSHPGGNITGMSDFTVGVITKRLELIKQVAPMASRIAVFMNSRNPTNPLQLKETQAVAPALGVTIIPQEIERAADLDRAFGAVNKERIGSVVIFADPNLGAYKTAILGHTTKLHLPSVWPEAEYVETGGLMAYGTNYEDLYRRAAVFVHKIVNGSKPTDLPVEQPTKFELVINLKTAKQIGLTIPPNVLARADRVIK